MQQLFQNKHHTKKTIHCNMAAIQRTFLLSLQENPWRRQKKTAEEIYNEIDPADLPSMWECMSMGFNIQMLEHTVLLSNYDDS